MFVYYVYYAHEDATIVLHRECFIAIERDIIEDSVLDCNELHAGMIYLSLKDMFNSKIFL